MRWSRGAEKPSGFVEELLPPPELHAVLLFKCLRISVHDDVRQVPEMRYASSMSPQCPGPPTRGRRDSRARANSGHG